MSEAVKLVEVWRGPVLECIHRGHAVVVNTAGEIVDAWGDPSTIILPRSSCKMLQALPLIESGAAEAMSLQTRHLAVSCASHNGSGIHTNLVSEWLGQMELSDSDLRCGTQMPFSHADKAVLIKSDTSPCQWHNNCSGKHTGFLAVKQHLKAGPEYVEIDHPVQLGVKEAFEDMTGETSSGHGIDGCSAPNFATSLKGLAWAMAKMGAGGSDVRGKAASRLIEAMKLHPDLVAGEERSCTELMRAMKGQTVVKTGAEGVFVAILPEQGLGIALKAEDGATRASECIMTALLVRHGVLDAEHPAAVKRMKPEVTNWKGTVTGHIQPTSLLV